MSLIIPKHYEEIDMESVPAYLRGMTVDMLIAQLSAMRDAYGGNTTVAVAVPGRNGFTTLNVLVAQPALIHEKTRQNVIAIVAQKESD